jgi:hypothetical protein
MKTFFNYIEDRFEDWEYQDENTIKSLMLDFFKNTKDILLVPLAEKPLVSQIYWFTNDFHNDFTFDNENRTVYFEQINLTFHLSSQTEEDLYKLKSKHKEELGEFTRLHKYDNYGKVIIDLHNTKRWSEGLKSAKEGNIVEMTEDAYYHFLECVPPKDFCGVSFVCGEPEDHNNKGEGIYLCGIKKGGKFYAQYGTVKEYRTKQLFKFI